MPLIWTDSYTTFPPGVLFCRVWKTWRTTSDLNLSVTHVVMIDRNHFSLVCFAVILISTLRWPLVSNVNAISQRVLGLQNAHPCQKTLRHQSPRKLPIDPDHHNQSLTSDSWKLIGTVVSSPSQQNFVAQALSINPPLPGGPLFPNLVPMDIIPEENPSRTRTNVRVISRVYKTMPRDSYSTTPQKPKKWPYK